MRLLRTTVAVASVAALAGVALAQGPGNCGGMGYGPGGMMGYGHGPGMMRGYGQDYGGPGMMGGGPGMMGWGGPGMMGFGYEMQNALGLSDDQRKKLDAIHDDLQTKNWEIMGKMQVEMGKMRELMVADPVDRAALDTAYKRMSDLRQQRFDAHITARERMAALLTKEQREQLKRYGPWWVGSAD